MADSASESDTDGAGSSSATPMSSSASNSAKPSIVISQFRLEELTNRLASLQQENKVLKIELETFKLKCKALQEENRDLRKASVTIQARAEQEEEFISNTLFKKIQALQKEKETLAVNYEKEEEFLTNELSRKLMHVSSSSIGCSNSSIIIIICSKVKATDFCNKLGEVMCRKRNGV
ncbi:unnamed protein product [Knipowitschia caucasica]